MPEPSILKISNIFWSFQGEGLRVGTPSVFLRLAGCSVQCHYCDTKNSWEINSNAFMPLDEILAAIEEYKKKYPLSQVVITGGEPLEQNLTEITAALKKKNNFLSIETNGVHFQDLPIDWWTVSPKDVTGYFIHEDLSGKINEIKLIVNKNLTPDEIKGIRSRVPAAAPIFLQPGGNDKNRYINTFLLFRQCQEIRIKNIRCGLQLHKTYGVE